MSMQFSIGDLEQDKLNIIRFVRNKKSQGNFSVVDIGGWAGGWSASIADLIVDINVVDSEKTLQLNVCQSLDKLLTYVQQYGKFDFCICSHTLEDLYNPYLLLENFSNIAKSGVIMVPYFKTELSHIESPDWIGYIHHRYIFKESNDTLLVIPKMPFLEKFKSSSSRLNLKVDWVSGIDYKIFMNNYLGPDVSTVINTFKSELEIK